VDTTIDIDASGLRPADLRACDIETAPYPGLATDLQSPTCVLLTQTSGTSHVHEAVFEDRIEWLGELRKLGAKIDIEDTHHASIHGPARLRGGEVSISDLRAGASLILAALAADGSSLIHGAHHVERGYENIDRKFQQLGASIVRSADTA
jgi:UDP-N-acetylglucosamine 1-carboxyvinyltransferase